ncbi:MAG: hypothetical protein AAFS13_08790, partial [Pseudomonadota bacterium]
MGRADTKQEGERMIATDRLKDALATALDRYAEMMGEPFKTEPKLETVPDEAVWAVVQPDGTGCTITATEGIATALRDLWSEALDQQALLRDRDTRPANDPDELTAVSLSWLMHHEMEHFGLGHLGLVGARGFTETNHPNARALIARSSAPLATATDLGFDTEDMSAISRCLELQADHDAIGMITGPYSNEGWPELRSRVASIFAVMILIDREDRKRGEVGHTHPRAATRIFQLLGHMAIFWSVPAQKIAWEAGRTKIDPADLPPEAEIEAFKTEVVHPAFR